MRAAAREKLSESVMDSLDQLARLGTRTNEGVTRVAWSTELFAAYEWVADRLRALGCSVEIDTAGNLIGRWHVGSGAPILVGSHLDTVPSGGRLDGVLGVVAAVHAIALLQKEGFEPLRPVWIVAFMDEEGTRFDAAMFGSRAFAGEDLTAMGERTDAAGRTLRDAMEQHGYSLARLPEANRIGEISAYFELHIEQGPVLEAEGIQIGAVTSIVGMRGYRVRLRGQANHAGTTPMRMRRDAFIGAARIAVELRDVARSHDDMTSNVGKIAVTPGGANVVPGLADFTVDVRAATPDGMRELDRLVRETVSRIAEDEGLRSRIEPTYRLEPLELDRKLIEAVERAAANEGATSRRMPSGAGHDAMVIGRHVPAAMIFIPSRGGISHSPDEFSPPAEVELGMRVLAATLRHSLQAE